MSNSVHVIDNISGTILFTTSIEKMDDAVSFATMMETEGLDIRIDAPSLSETLIKALGADENDLAQYKKSVDQELLDHQDDFGCMTTNRFKKSFP